ncbi:hypothetical protein B7494_g2806 [Chlorociboria aeruginascens]|nr:hypothetical protein B7494_g2806 [Chlorociboria aeruginascens]
MVVALMNSQTSLEHGAPSAERPPSASGGLMRDDGFTRSPAHSLDNQIDPGVPESSLGKFTRAKDQVNFVGSSHWEAVLEDIAELKIDLENTDTSEMLDFKPEILFGVNNHATRSEIVSSVPPRPYDQMWKNPDGTPLMWFGLLFPILGLASHFYAMSGDELHTIPEPFTSVSEMVSHYRDRTVQCLVEVNYLKPVRYTVETMCLYYILEFLQAKDSEFSAYIVVGIIIKVAMRLGYHRDASHYSSISPFDGEMRRRTWRLIFQLDLLTSALVGLPRMIREGEADTAEPKNLLDDDFGEDMTKLPPPRSSTDVTPVAFAIFKGRLLWHLGLIVDQINAITPPPYEDVMRLDSQLTTTHATLPPYLTMRPLSLSITDRRELILRRYALEICFQKSRCVLHRKYLIPGKSNPQFRYSRNASVDAAMRILEVQYILHEASKPAGQLYRERWKLSPRISQEYVLAAMILCLDLDWDMRFGKSHEDEVERIWPRDTRLQKMKDSYEIWSESSRKSTIAAKAAEALSVMLHRLEISNSGTRQERLQCSMVELPVSNPEIAPDATPAPQHITPEDLSHFDTSEGFDSRTQYFTSPSTTDLVSGMIDTETDFDWCGKGPWDSHFQVIPTNALSTGLQDLASFTFH